MASTHTHLLYHCVWSTKEREPLIRPEVEQDVWNILGGVGTRNNIPLVRVGGVEDHVHILAHVPKTMAVSAAMQRLKAGASKEIKETGLLPRFRWQDGYGAFSVSKSASAEVEAYIMRQRQHHRRQTFQDEFVAFLEAHEIEWDPRYIWG